MSFWPEKVHRLKENFHNIPGIPGTSTFQLTSKFNHPIIKINQSNGCRHKPIDMKRMKTSRVFLIVAIAFSLPLCSASFHYYALASADFLSRDPKLEAFDQDLSTDSCNTFKGMGTSNFDHVIFLTVVFKQIPIFSLEISPFDQTTSILRC